MFSYNSSTDALSQTNNLNSFFPFKSEETRNYINSVLQEKDIKTTLLEAQIL
ncbi:MAG: hypothetical protein GX895_00045 [Clostridiales bacterium]|uniref:hypothetical protein n=1 Tax=Clostridium sp. N3C TaxID=1776758 RepID=UPI0015BE49C1|nr:hypothetical protein [Clostridium sp. N3C]NLZ47178.1 hypothetical protein [Clostridiales bacterium]